jgi:N-6 DNA Methylase
MSSQISAITKNQPFIAVHTVGALLPADMLARISEGRDVSGSKPAEYHLAGTTSVHAAAERSWDYLKGAWQVLRDKLSQEIGRGVPADPTGLAIANWLEPLFGELGFGRLHRTGVAGIMSDDGTKRFPISHLWEHVPIHLTSWDVDLDKRPAPGAVPAQSLLQECLNRTEAHLWAVLSNGRQLRLLRDSTSLVGASYVEFDLEAIFDGELVSEFVHLYRLLHVSRFEAADGALPSTCWLETWRVESIEAGTRALDQLRVGVQAAITSLGTGFTSHPGNAGLRANLDPDLFKKALLRLVYRLVILFVAEDRDLLIPADADPVIRRRYDKYFSTARLRATAGRQRGGLHGDRWLALSQVFDGLGREEGLPGIGLPGIGGIYDNTPTDDILKGLSLSNEALLTAIRALSSTRDKTAKRNRAIDYSHLDSEELGSVYESLLELVPRYEPSDRSFELVELRGNERKTTGSYYTPTSLIGCILDLVLDPVLDDAQKRGELAASANPRLERSAVIAEELLKTTVCDPACGSGHFLVGAARRIAKRVAAVREQNPEPTIDAVRVALREVVGRCIYGVDLNPLAVELAKISLWLQVLDNGKAFSFLDAHIKHGNSLIGTTPALLESGIPDDAFKPIEGDDPPVAIDLRKRSAAERRGENTFLDLIDEGEKVSNVQFAADISRIVKAKSELLADVHRQESAFRRLEASAEYQRAKTIADAWCAAFVWRKAGDGLPAITESVFQAIRDPDGPGVSPRILDEAMRLSGEYGFFHWYLEFPEIFYVPPIPGTDFNLATGWSGGFSCVFGNPPWERIKLQEQEFFAQRDQPIANAANAAARKRRIEELSTSNPELAQEFSAAKRRAEGESHFLRMSQRYPLTGRGDVNSYSVFAETCRTMLSPHGRSGLVLPLGVGTDATTAPFFRDLVASKNLICFLGFENEGFILSRAVHHSVNFCLLGMTGPAGLVGKAMFSSKVRHMDELSERQFTIASEDILLVNPNTGTSPTFRTQRDADITTSIYRRIPVLIDENDPDGSPWSISFMTMFHMSNDSGLFHTREQLESDGWSMDGNNFARRGSRMLPLYEAKMLHHYDHRLGTYEGQTEAQANMGTLPRLSREQQGNPTCTVLPRYWIAEAEAIAKLLAKSWSRGWLLGWRDICRSTDERTMINSIVPIAGIGHPFPLMLIKEPNAAGLLAAQLSSFVFDYVARQKIGGTHLTYGYVMQLPALTPVQLEPHSSLIDPRVLELSYIAYDMEPFARDLGDEGAPFRWDEERRFRIRAELDALFFHLYGIERDDVDYIMETFPIVKRKDEARWGTYRTKDLILQIYDDMAGATVSGIEYQTIVFPPPGEGPRHAARVV